MKENKNIERRRSTCQGIQLLYRARKAGIEEHEREIQNLLSEYHNSLSPQKIQALRERNQAEINRLNFLLTENRKLLEYHRGNKSRKEQELNDLQNDYQFNDCSLITGSID